MFFSGPVPPSRSPPNCLVVSPSLDAGSQQGASPAPAQLEDPAADSDASDRSVTPFLSNVIGLVKRATGHQRGLTVRARRFDSEGDFEEGRRGELSYDEMFEPYADKRWVRLF